ARFLFDVSVPAPVDLPVTLIVDGGSCAKPEPVVFNFRRQTLNGPDTIEYQVELTAEPGRKIEVPAVLPLSPPSPGHGTVYAIEVRLTPAAEKHAVGAVRAGGGR